MEANERGSEGAEELLRFSFEEAREEQLSITARVPDESTGSLDSQQDTSSSHETVGYSELPAGERNPPVWRQGWKCTFAILGFYLLGNHNLDVMVMSDECTCSIPMRDSASLRLSLSSRANDPTRWPGRAAQVHEDPPDLCHHHFLGPCYRI